MGKKNKYKKDEEAPAPSTSQPAQAKPVAATASAAPQPKPQQNVGQAAGGAGAGQAPQQRPQQQQQQQPSQSGWQQAGGQQRQPQGAQQGAQQRRPAQQSGQQGGYQQGQGGYQQRGQQAGYQQRGPGPAQQSGQQGGYQQRGPGPAQQSGQQGGYQQRDRPQGGQQGGYQPRGPPQQQQQQRQAAPLPQTGNIKRGTLGRPGQVEVNYLKVDMSKMPKVAYHYDVKIMPERPKKFYRAAFEQFRQQNFGGLVAAFDGRASCYTVDKLPLNHQNNEVEVLDRSGKKLHYTIEIKETENSEVDLGSMRTYMNTKIYDKPMSAMQCLEVVLATPCHDKAIRAGRSFFRKPQGQRYELNDGYEALVGLYQSFVLGDQPYVNVDISHKSFPIALPIVEWLQKFVLYGAINDRTNLDNSLRPILAYLKGINVVYEPPASFGSSPRVYKVNGLSPDTASRQKFQTETETLTVAEYFRKRGHNLQYPNLHCLHVGPPAKNIYLPIELCHIEEGQALNRKDGASQVAAMIKFAATSTNERKRKIVDLLQYFQHNLDPTISRFGIQIGNQFIVVPTRVLQAPQLEYQDRRTADVFNGSWRMDRLKFLAPKQVVHKWAILHCEAMRMHYNKVAEFADMVSQQAGQLNVNLAPKPEIRTFRDERDMDRQFGELKQAKCDLSFVIIPNRGPTYEQIKQHAELQHGILTQCIKHNNVERRLNAQLIGNVLLKVNSKLNGTNHKIKDNATVKLDNVLFMGADVTHPSPDQRDIPSVVGVAGSHDRFGACYNMQYRLQRSTLEEIEDMESITLENLRIYKQYQTRYPEHILYYRDGVSDGQFPKIKNQELRGIYNACAKLGFKPKMTCVIVVKRHHTRFFPKGEPTPRNKFNNVDPGTVVDREIVHPNEMQFFMVSHQSIQGTAKPTRYNVIENTGNLDIDLLQQLTYNLCHMFPRCNRSVSYPAPAYLAHLAAARGRVYISGARLVKSLKEEYQKRLIVPEFLQRNPMYFV